MENISSWKQKSYSDRLGIPYGASEGEIKSAFRKLSIKYHPDRVAENKTLHDNYQEVYKLITEAYTALTDTSGKTNYGRGGGSSDNTYQRPKQEYTHTHYEEKKPEFNEKKEVENFIRYAKDNNAYEWQIKGIGQRMDWLVSMGVKQEKLLQEITPILTASFTTFTKENCEYDFQAPKVAQYMQELVKLGIKKEGLLQAIDKTIISSFTGYAKENCEYDFQIPGVQKFMNAWATLGIERGRLLQIATPILTASFLKHAKENSDYDFQASNIDKFMTALVKFGMDPAPLQVIAMKYKKVGR